MAVLNPLPFFGRWQTVALVLFCIVGSNSASAQCASPCLRQGSAFSSNQTNLGISFNTAGNAALKDGHYAFAEIQLAANSQTETQHLAATGFGFNLPDRAVITQLRINIQKRASATGIGTAVKDHEVRIIKKGVLAGSNKASAATWKLLPFVESYTGDADFWGVQLTGADVNAPDFGVAISAELTSGGSPVLLSAQIDQISMEIEYTVPSSLTVSEFTTSLQLNTVACKWTLQQEEAGTRMVLQQSMDQKIWKDLRGFQLSANATNTQYRHSDRLSTAGTYYYRVKMISSANEITYSKTNSIRYGEGELKLYPTAAQSMVYLEHIDPNAKIEVYNLNSQLMAVSTISVSERMLALRVGHLPKGMYIVRVGTETRKFVKE